MADVQIIATAICHGASQIVTGDTAEFRRIARDRIQVIEVPERLGNSLTCSTAIARWVMTKMA